MQHLTWAWDVTHRRVENESELREALAAASWDVVLCDCELPGLGPLRVLAVMRSFDLDVPLIMLSGAIAEEHAVDALKAGAHDIVIKGRWARLPSTVERELRQAEARRTRHAAEAALRESEERFRTLVQSMTDLVVTFDRDQRCTGVFGQWPATSQFVPSQFLGKRISEMLSKDPARVHEDANARALAGETVQYEYVGVTTGRHYQSSMAPMRGADGSVSGVLAVIRDITRLKELESQLIATDRLAAVGMIADGLSDDLNNSLATLTLNLDLVLRELQQDGVRDRIFDVRAAAERVRVVARDLKVFSRTEDAPAELDVEAVLDSAAHLAVSELLPRVQLHKRYAAVPPVFGSRSLLGQLLMGLIVAVARVTSASVRQPREVELTTRFEAEQVVVEVSGTEPVVNAETDVGLAVCRRLAEALGGQLRIEAAGCRLTMQRSKPSSATAATAPRPTAAAGRPRGRVLIVDDNAALARSLVRLVAPDHDVEYVESAREALELVASGRRYDAIVSDLMMPVMSGMELHAELDRICPDQAGRMVFMTGGVFVPEARDFLDRVPNWRLTKPFPPEQLLEFIDRYVER